MKKEGAIVYCPRCGSEHVTMQAVNHTTIKNRGCIGWFFWILLAICTFGLILIIPAVTNQKVKNTVHTEAVCQNCGNRWFVR